MTWCFILHFYTCYTHTQPVQRLHTNLPWLWWMYIVIWYVNFLSLLNVCSKSHVSFRQHIMAKVKCSWYLPQSTLHSTPLGRPGRGPAGQEAYLTLSLPTPSGEVDSWPFPSLPQVNTFVTFTQRPLIRGQNFEFTIFAWYMLNLRFFGPRNPKIIRVGF